MKKAKPIKAYMCGTDWYIELPNEQNDVVLYSSLKYLKKHKICLDECGIVEVTVTKSRIVKKGFL